MTEIQTTLRLEIAAGFPGVLISVVEGSSHRGQRHWLTTAAMTKLAGDLILLSSIVGTDSRVDALTAQLGEFRDTLGNVMDKLLDPRPKEETGPPCTVCGRVIHNPANMARHMTTHAQGATE